MNLERLRSFKPQIQDLARQYKIDPDSIRVFGSVARGEETEDSDVDFLVRTLPGCGLFRLGGFYGSLKNLLQLQVDVVTEGGLSPYIGPSILASAQPL
jgi:predicted nucleotidyltransferase